MAAIKNPAHLHYDRFTSFPKSLHRDGLTGIFVLAAVEISFSARTLLISRRSFRVEVYCLDWQIPMRVENLESPLLLALERFLIGIQLLLQRCLIEGLISYSRVLEDDGYTKVPAAVFGRVVARLIHPDFRDASELHFFLEHGVVILLEQPQKFVGVSPLGFVVVLG